MIPASALRQLLDKVLASSGPDDDGSNPDWRLRRRTFDAEIWSLGWEVVANDRTAWQPYFEPDPGTSWKVVPYVTNSIGDAFWLADVVLGQGWCREQVRVVDASGRSIFRTRFYLPADPDGGFEATHVRECASAIAAMIGAKLTADGP